MYQVLARKYRPRNFIELVGQNHVSRALTSALERGRLHHAYLFTGTRGVGKTTIARILAKCLNCETGITSTPCEVCTTCKAVNEGRFIDLIEIDAASRTKVEDTRELLDNVPYAPTQGRFKVYLIDEVHMLSTHSFNALLKTLEEPPEHVKFLFATTDPQKLPITVISRCLQFTLRPLAVDEITSHLTEILTKEEISAEKDAIWQIAESAQGSLRDALSLTDQAIAYGQGEIQHRDVKEMLGLIDRTIIYDLILAIHQNAPQRVSQLLMQFRQQALDVSLVLDQLISTLHELALLQYLPELSLKYSDEINQKILALSKTVSAQDLQLYYQIACKGRAELQLAVTQEQGFEMCVLRLLAFRPLALDEIVVHESAPKTLEHSTQSTSTVSVESAETDEPNVHTHTALESKQSIQELEAVDESHEQRLTEAPSVQAEPTRIPDHFEEPALDVESDDVVLNHTVSEQVLITEPENSDVLVFDIETDGLIGLEPSTVEPALSVQDMSLFPVETELQPEENLEQPKLQTLTDVASDVPTDLFGQPIEDTSALAVEELNLSNIEPVLENEPLQAHGINAVVSSEAIEPNNLMPQDILKLQEQVLEGEWTLEKWEFWFRGSQLSPAVQELAQYGLMTGQIDGASIFIIPQQYEGMLSQLQHALESELITLWPNTQFKVQYGEVASITPFIKQSERKEKAFQRAVTLMSENKVVKSLLDTFDAELQNVNLKL
ncbi:DNA polymerase III subunit gamma/tau [uncultured Acinetobacter sp.]|uniref:DNA polymerase III subunit gamma/tau n=1 Tax=uncultured Acinetobacter sp. TaxID=165433 RepID=UPI0025841808|nr:DNA polymerase III subunit gamma/tau [uncultured Acinetobacter sp.]